MASSIHAVTESTAQAKLLIDRVSSGSRDQTERIGQISNAANQIEKVTRQSSALAEENAATSQQLAAQAVAMHNIVNEMDELIGR